MAVFIVLVIAGIIGAHDKHNSNDYTSLTVPNNLTLPQSTVKASQPFGTTETVNVLGKGDNVASASVDLSSVIDPAHPADPSEDPGSGSRLVAVNFDIKALQATDDDADIDADVTATNGQTYHSVFNSVSECTDFSYGEVKLAAGQSASGCVVFQLPNGISVKSVTFGTALGTSGSWDSGGS